MFKPPVEEAEEVVVGGLSKVLVVLPGDGVTIGTLVDVLLFTDGRTNGVLVGRAETFAVASPCEPEVVGGLALRSLPVLAGFRLVFDDPSPTLPLGEVVFIN